MSPAKFPPRLFGLGHGEFGGEFFAKRDGDGGVTGGVQFGEESFDAGDGVWGDDLVRIEERGDEVERMNDDENGLAPSALHVKFTA